MQICSCSVICFTASNPDLEICRNNGTTLYTIYDTFGELMRVTSPGYPEGFNVTDECIHYILILSNLPVVLELEQHFHLTYCYSEYIYSVVDIQNGLLNGSTQEKTCTQQANTNVPNFYSHVGIQIEQPSPALKLFMPKGRHRGFELFVSGNNFTYVRF